MIERADSDADGNISSEDFFNIVRCQSSGRGRALAGRERFAWAWARRCASAPHTTAVPLTRRSSVPSPQLTRKNFA
jgi:hypothetical protein